MRNPFAVLFLLVLLLAACQPQPPGPATEPTVPAPTAEPTEPTGSAAPTQALPPTSAPAESVDLTRLPLGDGRLVTAPAVGGIWPCRINPNAGGAFTDGSWISADGTYDLTAKATVDGSVSWAHDFEMTLQGERRVLRTNDLPNHATGTYPIDPADDAYQTDRNPHSINEQTILIEFPAMPALAAEPSCAPGAIGVLLTGSVLFNALDAPGRDAVAHETQDGCQGHPQQSGVYHYHSVTTCLSDEPASGTHSPLMGYIVDGFGIYGRQGESGETLSSADLDECHGHTHEIDWDGQSVEMYHYHATWDFPYTVGCLRGSYDLAQIMVLGGAPEGAPNGAPPEGRPDLAAAAARLGISEQTLREALGPPPPDLAAAAARLGISEQALREALGVPDGPPPGPPP